MYPLFPAPEGTQISIANSHGFDLPVTPDILVLPSQLNPFAKRAGDVLCINPGRLTKGATAGTFARATVHPIIRNICSGTTLTKASDLQAEISPSETAAVYHGEEVKSVADAAVENLERTPHRLAADFDAVKGTEVVEDLGKPLDLECNMHEDKIMGNELQMQAELETNEPRVLSDSSKALRINHPDGNHKRDSFETLSSYYGDQSQPTLHRVLERTRVDIIRL